MDEVREFNQRTLDNPFLELKIFSPSLQKNYLEHFKPLKLMDVKVKYNSYGLAQ